MISIVMPTYNRPAYLSCVLEALGRCENITECTIITSEEPFDCVIGDLFRVFTATQVIRNLNTYRLGCNRNIHNAIKTGFEYNDKVIVLEDDIVPSKDFINYFIWAFKEYENDENILGISSYQLRKEKPPQDFLDKVVRLSLFNPWGWGLWKKSWEEIKKYEEEIFFGEQSISWDVCFHKKIIDELKYKFMFPKIGRTQNIGEVGTYVPSPEWQRANQFTPFNADSYNEIIKDFKETNDI